MQLADSLISADFFGSSEYYGHFTSIGDLQIKLDSPGMEATGYHRELDLSNSLGKVTYRLGEVQYSREYFCSYPDRVLAMRFEADRTEAISFSLGIEVIQDSSLVITDGNRLALFGWIDGNHRPFVANLEVAPEGGTVTAQNGELVLQNADRVDLFLTIATNYRMEYPHYTGEDPASITDSVLSAAVESGYDQLRKRHIQDYRSLYNRVSFELPGIDSVESLSTGERFRRLKSGMEDPGYAVLAFNLGRYMIISSSRPGTLPANLQGVWNTFRVAPWAGNYQSNINIQEIYWSCGPTDLAECQQPYIDWIEDLARSGEEVARRVYGTGGWVSHTTGNIWGHASPIGDHPWGMYPMGAAWHCQHVWDQYAFTGDLDYLVKQAYPLLKGASHFWLENLVPFEGYLITAPSVSAEHPAGTRSCPPRFEKR
jgi:alpha-L-fucosidase 2